MNFQVILITIMIAFQVINQLIVPLPIFLLYTLILIVFIVIDKSMILGLFCMLIPLSDNLVLYFVNIVFVFTLLIKFRDKIKGNNIILLLILCIIFIECFHVFININNGIDENIVNLLGFVLCLLPFVFINSIYESLDKIKSVKLFFLGYFTYTIITFIRYYINFGTINVFNNVKRFGFVEESDEIGSNSLLLNPNTIGVYSALIITILLVLIYFKKIKFDFIFIFMFFYSLLIGLMTVSRTFLLILIFIVIIYLFTSIQRMNIIALTGILFSIFAIFILFTTNAQLTEMLSKRIFESDDISGSRFSIYGEYLKLIFSNENIFSFGIGMQDYLDKVHQYNTFINQATHNVFLEVWTIWGIFGVILVFFTFCLIIFNSNFWRGYKKSDCIVKLLPFLVIIISAQFGQFFISFYHTFATLMLSLLFLYIKEGDEIV